MGQAAGKGESWQQVGVVESTIDRGLTRPRNLSHRLTAPSYQRELAQVSFPSPWMILACVILIVFN